MVRNEFLNSFWPKFIVHYFKNGYLFPRGCAILLKVRLAGFKSIVQPHNDLKRFLNHCTV